MTLTIQLIGTMLVAAVGFGFLLAVIMPRGK
jgi:hypothetical protein